MSVGRSSGVTGWMEDALVDIFDIFLGLELCEVVSEVIGMWSVCYFSRDTSCLSTRSKSGTIILRQDRQQKFVPADSG